jgi:hypothetical protein
MGDPERFYRSWVLLHQLISSFSCTCKKTEAKENARVPRTLRVVQPADDAAPRAAMRRCQARSGAHNLAIAARLVSPDALPAGTMLAASAG